MKSFIRIPQLLYVNRGKALLNPNLIPGVITGLLVPGGNKYRILAFQVGGVSKIETINCAHVSRGTQI
jgi:hypothetical protein